MTKSNVYIQFSENPKVDHFKAFFKVQRVLLVFSDLVLIRKFDETKLKFDPKFAESKNV